MKAISLKIVGWVKNLEDGSVELMIEGDKQLIDGFVKWAKKGPPFARVDKVEIENLKGLEKFPDFSIFF